MANILGNVYARLKTGVSNLLDGDDDDDKIKLQTQPVQSVSVNTRQSRTAQPRVRIGKSFDGDNHIFTNFKDNYKNFQKNQAVKVRENRQKTRDFISGILNKPKESPSTRVSTQTSKKELIPGGWEGVKSRAKEAQIFNPVAQFKGFHDYMARSYAAAPENNRVLLSPIIQHGGNLIRNAGFNPMIREQMQKQGYDVNDQPITREQAERIATDIGYALRGAGQATPWNQRTGSQETQRIYDEMTGLTPEGQTVEDIGRSTYLTALTWPALQAAGLLKVLPTFRVAGSVGLKEGMLPALKYIATSPQIGGNLLKYFGGQTALNLANHTLGEKYMGKNPAEFAGSVLMDSLASSLMLAGAESTIGAFGASKLLDNVKFIKNLKTNINQSVLQTLDEQMMPMWQNKFINSMVTDNQGNLMVNNPSFKAWQRGVEEVFKSELPKGNITGLINFMKNVPAAPPSYVTQFGSGVPSAQAVQTAMSQSPVTQMAQQFIAQSSQNAPALIAPTTQAAAPTITQGVQAAAPTLNQAAAQAVQTAGDIVTPESLRNANKAFNMENSRRMVEETINGAREHLRLDKPENIQKLANVLGVENPTPDATVTVLRAGTGAIEDGNFVTTRPELAQKYQSERPGSEIVQEEVPLRDLVQTDGLRGEFIYSPQKPETMIQSSMANFSQQQRQVADEAILSDVRAVESELHSLPADPNTGTLVMNNQTQAMLSQVGYALEDNPALITELDGRTVKALEDAGIQIQGTDGQFKDAGKALQEYRFQKTSPYTTQIYHGGTAKAASEIQPGYGEYGVDRQTQYPIGGYFAEDPNIASKFGDNIVSGKLPRDARVLDLTGKETVQDIWDALDYKPEFVSPYSSIQPDTSIEELGSQYNVLENLINQNPDIKDKLIKQGYSGLRFMDKTDGTNHPSVAIFEPNNIVNISDSARKSGLFNTSEAGKKLIADSNGKIDAERLYLLLQEAELYPTVEKFIEMFGDNDLSKEQLTEIYRQAKTINDLTPVAEQALTPDVGQLEQQAKQYSNAEEFIKAQGNPLYHGTDANFSEFSLKDFGKTDEGFLGKGVYLSGSKSNAKQYGSNLMEVIAYLKNPYIYDDSYFFGGFSPSKLKKQIGLPDSASATDIRNTLIENGYDGVIVNELKDSGKIIKNAEVVVFDPKNIKTKQQLTEIYRQAQTASDLTPATEQALTPDVGQQIVDRGVTETGQTAQVGDQQVPVGASGATADDLAQATGQPQDIVGATEVPVSAAGQVEAPITQNKYEEAMNDIATLLLPSGERPALTAGTTQVRTRAQALKALRNLSPTERIEVFNQLRSRLTPIEMAPPGTPFTVQTGEQARKLLQKYPGANIQVMNELPPGTEPINSLTQNQIDVMLTENPVGKVEELVYGSATPEQVEFEQGVKSGAGFFSNKTRALQENASRIVGEWTESPSPVMRNFSRLLQGFSGGLGKTAEDVARKGQYTGGIDYANKLAGDTQKYVYDLVGSDAETMEKLHAVLDPDLAKKSVKFEDLSEQEQEAVGVLRTISDFINDTNYKNGFLTEEQWLSNRGGKYIARAYEEYDYPEEVDTAIRQTGGKFDLNPFKKRGVLTDWKEENAIRDPAYLMAKRLQQTLFNDTVKKMSEELLNTAYVSDIDKPGYVKVSDHKAYGDLAGKYLRKDMMEDIKGFFFTHDAAQKTYDLLNMYDRNPARKASKKVLTVFNPAVQLGNQTGNYVFAWLSGINPVTFTKNKKWATTALNENDPLIRRMTMDGILGTDLTKADITRMAQELKQGVQDKNILQKIDETVSRRYGKVDDIAKVSAMKTWLDRGFSYEEAARRTYNGFQNYRTVGWMFDVAAKTPVLGNPFVRFKADLGRILKNAAVDHPFRLAATLTGIGLFGKAASMLSGETEEDRKTREGRIGAPRVPFTNISLEFQTPWGAVNAARLIGPYSYNSADAASVLGDFGDFLPYNNLVSFKDGDFQLTKQGVTNDPLLGPIAGVLFDTDFRGKSVADPDQNKYTGSLATPQEKALNRLKYLGESYSPPGIDDINRVLNSFMGKEDYYGRTFTPGQSIARLFGLKVEEFGPEQAQERREKDAYFQLNKVDGLQKDISTIYNDLAKGDITPEQAEKRASAKQAEMDKIFNDIGQPNLSGQSGPVGDVSPLSKTEQKKIKSFLEAGIEVSDQDLLNYYIGDVAQMPDGNTKEALKKQEAAFKVVDDVLESDLSEEQKALVLNNVGINEDDARYYLDASESQQVRYGQVVDMIEAIEDPSELFDRLVALKREVNGNAILTSTVISDLYENGYISSSMKKLLGKYRYNPSTGEVELSRSSSENSKKPAKFSPKLPSVETPQLRLNSVSPVEMPRAIIQNTPSVSMRIPDNLRPESFSSSRVTNTPTAGSKISPRIRQGARVLSQLGSS